MFRTASSQVLLAPIQRKPMPDLANGQATPEDSGKPIPFPDPVELFGNKAIDMARHLMGLPAQVMDAGMHYTQTGDADPLAQSSMDMASALAGRTPFASPGTAGVFGGKLALGADLDKLADAQAMSSELRSALAKQHADFSYPAREAAIQNEIYKRYGWFQAPDAGWRFKISDAGAGIKPGADMELIRKYLEDSSTAHTMPLPDFYHHPTLFEHYPQFKDWKAEVFSHPVRAAYTDRAKKLIGVDPTREPEVVENAIAHESQHGVQGVEGFHPGTNSTDVGRLAGQAAINTGVYYGDPTDFWKTGAASIRQDAQKAAKSIYGRSIGEADARNAANQLLYENSGKSPIDTYDIPPERQLAHGDWLARQTPEIQQYVRALTGQK